MIYLIITFEVGQEMTSYPQHFIDRCLI